MASVTFDGVGKTYPDGTTAVHGLQLEIADGEFLVFVGPSGCGKTTALRMVAGLEEITEGVLRIGDRVVNHVPSRDRDIAMVFQSYALYPHLSVYENIAFGLKVKKMPKEEIDRRVQDAARVLDLEPFLERKPRALSGGQRQRVAMGRAIVREPAAFLMDEPLSNLDAKLRVQMRAEISRLQHELGTTTIYVTHDQVEAMTMGERVAVMRKGELQQVAEPQELYDRPVNLFVGGFIGSPAMNMVEATLERDNGGLVALRRRASASRSTRRRSRTRPALSDYDGQDGHPRHPARGPRGRALAARRAGGQRLHGRRRAARGARLRDHGALRRSTRRPPVPTRWSSWPRTCTARSARGAWPRRRRRSRPSSAASARARRVQEGDSIEVAVDTRALHFFDPETGLGIYGVEPKGAGMSRQRIVGARRSRRRADLAAVVGRDDGGGEREANGATSAASREDLVDRRSGPAPSRSRSRR